MKVKLTLRNYRCFRTEQPAVLEIGPGFTSFIGPNNAGKSSLLKFFFETRHAWQHLQGLQGGSNTACMFFGPPTGLGPLPAPITDQSEIVYEQALSPLEFELEVEETAEHPGPFVKKAIWTYFAKGGTWTIGFVTSDGREIRRIGDNSNLTNFESECIVLSDGSRVRYQTILQAAQAISDIQYIGPFRNAINEGAGAYYDLQLGTAFLAHWHSWKAGGNKEMNRAVIKVTDDIRRLMGVQSLEINASIELRTLQILIDGRPHKLSEVGAGIAQLIIVLGNALIRRPSFIAIDEPETHLHPALQLEFLATLASYSTYGVIFATHSIGLARAISDRTYSVQASEKGSIVKAYDKTPRYAEFLGSLGIAGLQDIGWNRVLLVEGTTDVRVFQQFLKKYAKDRHVVILPLGGGSMIHSGTATQLEEVARLCDHVFAIIDSERKSPEQPLEKGRSDFAENCRKLGIKCLVTKWRATENYLTDRCVKQVYGPQYKALGEYGNTTGGSNQFWGKSDSWRGAQEMTRDELDQTDLGKFLSEL